MSALFACAKCNVRVTYEELSPNHHLCKLCQRLNSTCSYCRSEFQLESKHSKESICQRCAKHVEKYGLPNACKYCKLIAAFIGSKCERCAYKEKKYGKPVTCEQCQQNSAFKKLDKLVPSKNLCWLCARSYKKLLSSKTKLKVASKQKLATKMEKRNKKHKPRHSIARAQESLITNPTNKIFETPPFLSQDLNTNQVKDKDWTEAAPVKTKDNLSLSPVELNTSQHFVMVTKLQEEIEVLKKNLQEKDRLIMEKDKKITQIKAENFENEKDFRNKSQHLQKDYNETMSNLQIKNRELQYQISQLTRELNSSLNKGISSSLNSSSFGGNLTTNIKKKQQLHGLNNSNILTFNSPTHIGQPKTVGSPNYNVL